MFSKLMGSLKLMYSKETTIFDEISKFYLKLLSSVKKSFEISSDLCGIKFRKVYKICSKTQIQLQKKIGRIVQKGSPCLRSFNVLKGYPITLTMGTKSISSNELCFGGPLSVFISRIVVLLKVSNTKVLHKVYVT